MVVIPYSISVLVKYGEIIRIQTSLTPPSDCKSPLSDNATSDKERAFKKLKSCEEKLGLRL